MQLTSDWFSAAMLIAVKAVHVDGGVVPEREWSQGGSVKTITARAQWVLGMKNAWHWVCRLSVFLYLQWSPRNCYNGSILPLLNSHLGSTHIWHINQNIYLLICSIFFVFYLFPLAPFIHCKLKLSMRSELCVHLLTHRAERKPLLLKLVPPCEVS